MRLFELPFDIIEITEVRMQLRVVGGHSIRNRDPTGVRRVHCTPVDEQVPLLDDQET